MSTGTLWATYGQLPGANWLLQKLPGAKTSILGSSYKMDLLELAEVVDHRLFAWDSSGGVLGTSCKCYIHSVVCLWPSLSCSLHHVTPYAPASSCLLTTHYFCVSHVYYTPEHCSQRPLAPSFTSNEWHHPLLLTCHTSFSANTRPFSLI